MDVLKAVNDLIRINQDSKDAYDSTEITIGYCERAYLDLAHACELTNFNAFGGYQLAKKIKDNQIQRREAKELREQLQPLLDLLIKHQSFFKELKQAHATVEMTRNTQRKRTYTPKTNVI